MDRVRKVSFWLLAGCSAGETLCWAGWQRRLGEQLQAMRRFLEETGEAVRTYPSPYRSDPDFQINALGNGLFRVDPYAGRPAADDEAGFTDCEIELFERDLGWEDVAGLRLDVERLLREAGKAFGVAPDIMDCGGGIYRLGTRGRRVVFAYLGGGESAARALTAHLAGAGANCDLYVAQRTPSAAAFGVLAGRELVELGEHLDISEDGVFSMISPEAASEVKEAGENWAVDKGGNEHEARHVAYEVGGKFRIEAGNSRVVTLKSKEVWSVPPFTRVVLEVLLTDTRAGGLTSEIIHQAAVKLYRERFPELRQANKGRNSDVVGEKPLKQYFRISGKSNNRGKTPHGLFKMINSSGGKKPSYAFKKGVVKAITCPD